MLRWTLDLSGYSCDVAAAVPLEKQAMRNLADADMIRTILSNIKVQGAGSSQSSKGRAKGGKKKR